VNWLRRTGADLARAMGHGSDLDDTVAERTRHEGRPRARRPVAAGHANVRTRQGKRRAFLVGSLLAVLNLTGLVMVLSASSVTSLEEHGSPWYQFTRQLMWLAVGSVALLVALQIDYRRWRAWAPWILRGTVVLLVLVLFVGRNVNGASRWIGLGQFQLQPSELAKLAILLYVGDLLARRAHRIDQTQLSVRPVMVVFLLVAALVMAQPNLGTTILIFSIVFVMLFVAGVPTRNLAFVLGAAGLAGAAFAVFEPYRMRRLMAFRDPWADPLNTGYQTLQSTSALANGGGLGTGLGESRAKYGFLPEAHTDFIYAVLGEELGFVGAVILLAVFVALGAACLRVASRAPDRFGMLVVTGITTWWLVQAFVNIGATVGVLPITGVPLPFVSFGGSSLIVNMIAAGIVLNVARQSRAHPEGGSDPARHRHPARVAAPSGR
jgi:cell division protein FtsW